MTEEIKDLVVPGESQFSYGSPVVKLEKDSVALKIDAAELFSSGNDNTMRFNFMDQGRRIRCGRWVDNQSGLKGPNRDVSSTPEY